MANSALRSEMPNISGTTIHSFLFWHKIGVSPRFHNRFWLWKYSNRTLPWSTNILSGPFSRPKIGIESPLFALILTVFKKKSASEKNYFGADFGCFGATRTAPFPSHIFSSQKIIYLSYGCAHKCSKMTNFLPVRSPAKLPKGICRFLMHSNCP